MLQCAVGSGVCSYRAWSGSVGTSCLHPCWLPPPNSNVRHKERGSQWYQGSDTGSETEEKCGHRGEGNHRITELQGVEGTFGDHLNQPPVKAGS